MQCWHFVWDASGFKRSSLEHGHAMDMMELRVRCAKAQEVDVVSCLFLTF